MHERTLKKFSLRLLCQLLKSNKECQSKKICTLNWSEMVYPSLKILTVKIKKLIRNGWFDLLSDNVETLYIVNPYTIFSLCVMY